MADVAVVGAGVTASRPRGRCGAPASTRSSTSSSSSGTSRGSSATGARGSSGSPTPTRDVGAAGAARRSPAGVSWRPRAGERAARLNGLLELLDGARASSSRHAPRATCGDRLRAARPRATRGALRRHPRRRRRRALPAGRGDRLRGPGDARLRAGLDGSTEGTADRVARRGRRSRSSSSARARGRASCSSRAGDRPAASSRRARRSPTSELDGRDHRPVVAEVVEPRARLLLARTTRVYGLKVGTPHARQAGRPGRSVRAARTRRSSARSPTGRPRASRSAEPEPRRRPELLLHDAPTTSGSSSSATAGSSSARPCSRARLQVRAGGRQAARRARVEAL